MSDASDDREYRADQSLVGIYRLADELDAEGLEILCPGYTGLAAVEKRYTDENLIGKGALKEIYRCYDRKTKRLVALARPRADLGPDCYDDFVQEAWLVSSLRHPNIIKVHDAGVDSDGRPFFTMDLKGNTTLKDLVKQSAGRREMLTIFLKICDAVAYAHSEKIIHRDLKPENIQCDSFGEVLVCDWGLGKSIGKTEAELLPDESAEWIANRSLTLHGEIKGSLGYMAPEQILKEMPVDERCDIFALGCLLHFILTGSAPFSGTKAEIFRKTTEYRHRSIRKLFPGENIPKGLEAVTLKAIAREPLQRYESVTLLQADIGRYLSGRTTSAERPSLFRRGRLFIRRNSTPFTIAMVAILIMSVTGVSFLNHLRVKELEAQRVKDLNLLLSSEFSDLSAEYENLVVQSEEPKQELANRLLMHAIRKKTSALFTSPVVPFREIDQILDRVLVLDPGSPEGRFQYFSNQCIRLNFAEALRNPPDPNHRNASYMKMASAFPDFNFSENKRPSIGELSRFFREVVVIDHHHAALMTAILVYDWEARKDRTGYAEAIGAAFGSLWPANAGVSSDYLAESDELVISSTEESFAEPRRTRGGDFILRLLDVDKLVLKVDGKFDLKCLQRATVRQLDVSALGKPKLDKRMIINGLESVVIRKDQLKAEWLKKLITSDGLSRPEVIVSEK
ncbi:serine/threonine protein kinase [Luteolibacter sp. AS25]|uniref:serine/threonine protein kinase n=1 Tax=Luteolibacter sp. AS25 TaxID=3135776 RepID=UPI00398A6D17